MRQYLLHNGEDIVSQPLNMRVPDLTTLNGMAYIFHYHIYNVPVQEIGDTPPNDLYNDCYIRVVFSDTPYSNMKDVDLLWDEVLDELHYYEKLYARLLGFDSSFVTQCTKCSGIDLVNLMAECQLCNSPLCKSCYEQRTYCDSHLS